MKKKGTTGVLMDAIIMLSLVLCLGSIYWFIMYNKNNIQPNGFTPGFNEPESVAEPEINVSLAEVLKDLKNEGCRIITIKTELFLDSPKYVDYSEFRVKALEIKNVVISPSESGYVLVVTRENIQWVWIPS